MSAPRDSAEDKLRHLVEQESANQPRSATVDERTIDEVAHLLYPPDKNASTRDATVADEGRAAFIHTYRSRLSRGSLSDADDVLFDQLRYLRGQRDEIDRRIRVLLAYARTVPPGGRKYRLRELSEAAGLSMSTVRNRVEVEQLREIERLDLDDERREVIEELILGRLETLGLISAAGGVASADRPESDGRASALPPAQP